MAKSNGFWVYCILFLTQVTFRQTLKPWVGVKGWEKVEMCLEWNVRQFGDFFQVPYNAPFFTTWFCTNWTILFFPLYFLCRIASNRCQTPGEIFSESIRNYRDKGFTAGNFKGHSSIYCTVVRNKLLLGHLQIGGIQLGIQFFKYQQNLCLFESLIFFQRVFWHDAGSSASCGWEQTTCTYILYEFF